jgi:hypothetical protein
VEEGIYVFISFIDTEGPKNTYTTYINVGYLQTKPHSGDVYYDALSRYFVRHMNARPTLSNVRTIKMAAGGCVYIFFGPSVLLHGSSQSYESLCMIYVFGFNLVSFIITFSYLHIYYVLYKTYVHYRVILSSFVTCLIPW